MAVRISMRWWVRLALPPSSGGEVATSSASASAGGTMSESWSITYLSMLPFEQPDGAAHAGNQHCHREEPGYVLAGTIVVLIDCPCDNRISDHRQQDQEQSGNHHAQSSFFYI